MKETNKNRPVVDKSGQEKEKKLTLDELEQVAGGFSLKDAPTVDTTDIGDDTISKS